MERVTIRELSEAVISELERLGYASGTIKLYQKLYEKLLRYADEKCNASDGNGESTVMS